MSELYYHDEFFHQLWWCEYHYKVHQNLEDLPIHKTDLEEHLDETLDSFIDKLHRMKRNESYPLTFMVSQKMGIYSSPIGVARDNNGDYVIGYKVFSWERPKNRQQRPFRTDSIFAGLRALLFESQGMKIGRYELYSYDKENDAYDFVHMFEREELIHWMKCAEAELPQLIDILEGKRKPLANVNMCPKCKWKDKCPNFYAPMTMEETVAMSGCSVMLDY